MRSTSSVHHRTLAQECVFTRGPYLTTSLAFQIQAAVQHYSQSAPSNALADLITLNGSLDTYLYVYVCVCLGNLSMCYENLCEVTFLTAPVQCNSAQKSLKIQ